MSGLSFAIRHSYITPKGQGAQGKHVVIDDAVVEQGAAVVLVGNFNPAIFNPDWLARQEIIDLADADDAKVDVVHPEITHFRTGDFVFEVTTEKFSVVATAEPFIKLPDLIVDVFSKRLSHTPIRAAGINLYRHFQLRDRKQQHSLGRALAPIEPWGDWGKKLEADDPKLVGGMTNLTMQQKKPEGTYRGEVNVTVQPSVKAELGRGVYVHVNDHYQLNEAGDPIDFPQLITNEFAHSIERSKSIIAQLYNRAQEA